MAVILDTGIVFAYYDRSDSWHRRAVDLIDSEEGELIIPAPVIPELDHLLGRFLGRKARRVLYAALSDGYFFVADVPRESYPRIAAIDRQYADLGFVDAAIVAIAESLGLFRIATTDRRDFAPLLRDFPIALLP
ncbi:MAG TPA: PIN domain-containing protein [Thermoanaerobaculia bacterium]|nr:PIN domain-containing protein [Thermoanaerobaculia bacterium]